MKISGRAVTAIIVGALLLVGAVWLYLKETPAQSVAAKAAAQRLAAARSALREADAPAKIVGPAKVFPARTQTASAYSVLRQKVRESTDFFAIYNELSLLQSAESKFLSATILDFCQGSGKTRKGPSVEERLRLVNAQMTGKYINQRQALFASGMQRSATVLCRDFPMAITPKMIEAAFDAAAEAGDIHGKLNRIRTALVAKATDQRDPNAPLSAADLAIVRQLDPKATEDSIASFVSMSVSKATGPTPEQVEVLREALWSKDPTQILFAGPVLTALYNDYELKFRGTETDDRTPSVMLWTSIACYFGDGCDANNALVQRECIEHARCDVGSYDQLLQRYHLVTEAEWAVFQKEREFFIAVIESQNWARLQEARGKVSKPMGSMNPPTPWPPRFRFRF